MRKEPLYHMILKYGKKSLMPCAISEGPDKRAQPCSLIWTFCLSTYISVSIHTVSGQRRPRSADFTNCGIVKTTFQCFCIGFKWISHVIKCGVVKTNGRLVTSTLRDFVDVASARVNYVINSLNRQNYFIELYIVGWVIM